MLAENHLSSQDDIVRQLMSIRTLYERRFGKEVRGPADPDGAAELQLSGSDDSRGQQPTTAPSQRQAPAQFRGYVRDAADHPSTHHVASALSHNSALCSFSAKQTCRKNNGAAP